MRPRAATPPAHDHSLVAVPRFWLIALAALVVVPWLIVLGIYEFQPEGAPSVQPGPAAETRQTNGVNPGPWGNLDVTSILISPPLEFLSADWGRDAPATVWHFPDTSPERLGAFLSEAGLPPDQVARLRAAAQPDPPNHGLVVTPDPAIVLSMDNEVRRRVYTELAKTPLNPAQAFPFQFAGSTADAWLGGSLISPQTRQLIAPLIYRDGMYLNFGDPAVVRSQIGDVEERRRLAKVILRQATMLVRLTVDDQSEVAGLAEYWGRGGRRTDLRPLLESVAAGGPNRTIDIVHLLPSFARDHLYRYPRVSPADLNQPMLANCLWTALNFFAVTPDDTLLDGKTALSRLKQDYYLVQTDFQFGDIVGFVSEKGSLYHVAVLLADDLVFGKNGASELAPWTIQSIGDVKAYYRYFSANPRLLYHRRKDF